jgi:hypothetical protein
LRPGMMIFDVFQLLEMGTFVNVRCLSVVDDGF